MRIKTSDRVRDLFPVPADSMSVYESYVEERTWGETVEVLTIEPYTFHDIRDACSRQASSLLENFLKFLRAKPLLMQ